MTDLPEASTEWAVTERGATLHHSKAEVKAALTLLVLNGGKTIITAKQLKAEKVKVHRNTLRVWRDVCFPRLYHQIRNELGEEVSKEAAGRLYERALEADDATHRYIKAAVEKVDEVPAEHLAKNAAQLAQAASQSIQTAELLRGKPTERVEHRTVGDMIGTLERLGVAERKEDVIEAEVVEEESVPA